MARINMNPNMFQTFDLGSAVQAGQQITENRLRNQALADDQTKRQDMLKNRKKAQEIRTMYDKMPDQIAALEREGMFEQADQLRDSYINSRKGEIDILNTMRDSIDETNYKQFRQDMIQAGAINPDMLPVEYSDDWFRKQDEEKKRTLQNFTITSVKNGAVIKQDYVTENGEIRWDLTGDPYADADKDGKDGKGRKGLGDQFEYKASDDNSIRSSTAELFGGFYDPVSRRYSGIDPDKVKRVASINEEASRIFAEKRRAGKDISHSTAVAQAARKLGVADLQDYRDTEATDPLNILQQ